MTQFNTQPHAVIHNLIILLYSKGWNFSIQSYAKCLSPISH
ncbi:hypothetical protein [Staphylococcus petrasii]|nr:hypothetical protein [Staphylococcus petrasii]